ncbi:MAG: hypothetical protein ACOC2U_01100 [bacterium]
MSALHTQIWLNTIEETLKSDWEILTRLAKNDNINLYYNGINRKVVIPNAGADPVVTKNNSSFPLNISGRTDTTVEYDVDAFRAQPTRVLREDALSVSYDKISSIVESMFGALGEAGKYDVFSRWIHEDQAKVEFTGTTGLEIADILKAKAELDKQKVPATNRILLLNAEHANQLLTTMLTKDSNIAFNDNDGMMILNRPLFGFQVVQLPFVVEFASGTTTPVAYDEIGAENNIPVSLAYHRDLVSVAKADSYIFYNEGDAAQFGDIMSGEAYFGGKYRRNDFKGVVQIYKQ